MDASKQCSQVDEAIRFTYMDKDFFKAAENGDMQLFNKYVGDFCCLIDPMLNTALHIHTRANSRMVDKTKFSIDFVEQLVAKSPLLLQQRNSKEEIPLHVAAANGNAEVVKFIIRRTKELERLEDPEKGTESEASSRRMMELLRMKDDEGNTPLHKAVESGSGNVVQLLMKETDTEFSFSTNKRGETPLYLASKRGYHHSMVEILNNCNCMSTDYGGPDGTTALHAAAMSGNYGTVKKLLENKNDLIGKIDDKGWTPLHYAAHFNCNDVVKLLLEMDASAAYIRDKERGSTPLHVAAWNGNMRNLEEIITHCPGCCDIVDKNGWNFLHFLFVTLRWYIMLEALLNGEDDNKFKGLPMISLLHQEDINGITPYKVFYLGPAHLYVVGADKDAADKVSKLFGNYDITFSRYIAKEKERKQVWESLKEISTNVLVAGKHVHDFFFETMEEAEELTNKQQEFIDTSRDAHLVVVALIATVTFAAAFTIPGGNNGEKGTAIMIHDSAFKAFIITNTFAFVSSLLAIFLHFLLTYFRAHTEHAEFQMKCILIADGLTFLAMIAMVIAFSTGSYAMLQSSLGFAVATCTLVLTSIPCLLLSLYYLGKRLFG